MQFKRLCRLRWLNCIYAPKPGLYIVLSQASSHTVMGHLVVGHVVATLFGVRRFGIY